MKFQALFDALREAHDDPPPELARVPDKDLPALARALAKETEGITGSLSSGALHWVPKEIVRRGPGVLPVLDRELRRLLEPDAPVDLCVLLFCPRVLLRAEAGMADEPAVAPLFQKVMERGFVDCVGDALATLPIARRSELLLPYLRAMHAKEVPPWDLVRAIPTAEGLVWLAPRMELWSKERGVTGVGYYAHQLGFVLAAFAREVPEGTAALLDGPIGSLRATVAEALGEHGPGSVAARLAADLAHRDAEYARTVDKALRSLAAREPDAVRSALEPLLASRSKKAAAAAKAILGDASARKGGGGKKAAPSDPGAALEALVRGAPRRAVDALLKRQQDHEYSKPFTWLDPPPEDAALLVAVMEWAANFLPIQTATGGKYFDQRWGDAWSWLHRKGGPVRALAPWAAAESVSHCTKPGVTRTVLGAFESVFGPEGDPALRALTKGARPGLKKAVEAHLVAHAR